jgi:predicted N-acyltransferase
MLELRFVESINEISAGQWNALSGTDYPFSRYEFLQALEECGVVGADTGWQPHHLLAWQGAELVALLPLFIKHHSYGEYVFDWGWADAYRQNGLNYYPKLLSAIPYTPVTGPRFCIAEGFDQANVIAELIAAIIKHAQSQQLSSFHLLFPGQQEHQQLNNCGLSAREAVHFQWFNRGYCSFNDFLQNFSSRKRKNLNKERRAVQQQNIHFDVFSGRDMNSELWQRFYLFYQMTYAKRSGHGGYLNQHFFELLAERMAEQLVVVLARQDDEYIAGALNFRDKQTLYGRYWGCSKELDHLHFETCYYQGIEYCIKHGLKRFDPGVQGEHKLARGFEPVNSYSNHWLQHEGFQQAVEDFLQREKPYISQYFKDCQQRLPFKKPLKN